MSSDLSLKRFHEKALRREPVSVVFLGGSLTWGANASDPQTTSYRGLMMDWLRKKYPQTPMAFHDAAIGGTGSQLAMFRLDRDVFPHKPDLVFLDFTVNDGADVTDPQTLASYERVVRELLGRNTMVFPVLMMFRWHAEKPDAPLPPRHEAHQALARAYQLPFANTIPLVVAKLRDGIDLKTLWPFDGAHPDDPGYRLFFEAVRDVYEKAQSEEATVRVPEKPVFEDRYSRVTRRVLVEGALPEGWTREKTYRTALWFDGQASRWMGDVACASAAKKSGPLEVEFEGSMVGVFGERNGLAPAIRVWIDGRPVAPPKAKEGDVLWPMDTSRFAPPRKGSGNLFGWQVLANDLAEGRHTLRIEPVWEGADKDAELRIESICSAGR
ncbi:MAG: SGNH/GDSL hydrolase family protein [Chthoniobacterales bacterium]|nr:SGNH/GDSL hydrolase family protein [Chthoniobacterales bacterium]